MVAFNLIVSISLECQSMADAEHTWFGVVSIVIRDIELYGYSVFGVRDVCSALASFQLSYNMLSPVISSGKIESSTSLSSFCSSMPIVWGWEFECAALSRVGPR